MYRQTMIAAARGPYWTGGFCSLRGGGLGAVPAAALALDQLMPGRVDLDRRQVEDLAAVHPGYLPARQTAPAAAAAARLMPYFPVRPGHLGQRRALMPVLPAGFAAGLLPQRPRPGRRLAEPFARWWLGGVPRGLPPLSLKLSDPLPGPLQFRPRLRQLTAQRHHQGREHLGGGRALINGHTGTLRLKIT
jgi:hypothetical protein